MTWRRRAVLLTALLLAASPTWTAQSGTTPTPAPTPAVGDVFADFDAEGVDGETKHIAFPKGSHTIVVFFLSGCPTCHRMIPEWNKMYKDRPKGMNMVGVLMDKEPPNFFIATPIDFPVVRSPGKAFLDGRKIYRAPVTLRIAAGGKIEDVGVGWLDRMRLGQFFRP
jgi:hypothetical protein